MFRSTSSASYLAGSTIHDPNGFPMRFLAVLAGIVAFVAAVAGPGSDAAQPVGTFVNSEHT